MVLAYAGGIVARIRKGTAVAVPVPLVLAPLGVFVIWIMFARHSVRTYVALGCIPTRHD